MAITGAEQIFSAAWNPVRGASDWICGSLELSNGRLRTAAVLYLPKVVSLHPSKPTTPCVTSIGSSVPIPDLSSQFS
jgi:hypothetical protein